MSGELFSVTNAYIKGVPVAEILRTADWTNERTFRKYYIRSLIVARVKFEPESSSSHESSSSQVKFSFFF